MHWSAELCAPIRPAGTMAYNLSCVPGGQPPAQNLDRDAAPSFSTLVAVERKLSLMKRWLLYGWPTAACLIFTADCAYFKPLPEQETSATRPNASESPLAPNYSLGELVAGLLRELTPSKGGCR